MLHRYRWKDVRRDLTSDFFLFFFPSFFLYLLVYFLTARGGGGGGGEDCGNKIYKHGISSTASYTIKFHFNIQLFPSKKKKRTATYP